MNYFPFTRDPYVSAIALDDKRLRRVYQEAVMLLAERQRILYPELPNPYKKPMPMPPALLGWSLGANAGHWLWVWCQSLQTACIERFGCGVGTWVSFAKRQDLIPVTKADWPTEFINLAKSQEKALDYTNMPDTHAAYRKYVAYQWRFVDKRAPKWTLHGPPVWYTA